MAFLELKKYVAEKLGIPNGVPAGKVAGAVKKEVQEANPELSTVEVCKKAKKHLDENLEKFKKMLN